jgi:hypothetical protein
MPANPETTGSSHDAQWLSVAAARDAILGAVTPVHGREAVALRAGFERVLARDVVAPFDVPAHVNSAPPGEAYESNRYTLHCALQRLNVETIDLSFVCDEPGALEETLGDAAAQADAVITTGGVSAGEPDYVRALMAKLGSVHFWRIQDQARAADRVRARRRRLAVRPARQPGGGDGGVPSFRCRCAAPTFGRGSAARTPDPAHAVREPVAEGRGAGANVCAANCSNTRDGGTCDPRRTRARAS